MADIFDQVASEPQPASAPDIFDQVAAQPGPVVQAQPQQPQQRQSPLDRPWVGSNWDKPIVNFGGLKAEDLVSEDHPIARGVIKGTEDFGSGLTAPGQLGLMAAIPGSAAVGKTISRLISGGFSLQMLWGAIKQSPTLYKQIKAGQTEAAAQTATEMGLGSVMGGLSAAHAITGEKAGAKMPAAGDVFDQVAAQPTSAPQTPQPLSATLPTPEQADQQTTASAQVIVSALTQPQAPIPAAPQPELSSQALAPAPPIQQETLPNHATSVEQSGQEPVETQQPEASSQAPAAVASGVGPVSIAQPGAAGPSAPADAQGPLLAENPKAAVQETQQVVTAQQTKAPAPKTAKPQQIETTRVAEKPQQIPPPAPSAEVAENSPQTVAKSPQSLPATAEEVRTGAKPAVPAVDPELQKLREAIALSPDLMGKGKLVAYAKLPPDVQAKVDRLADGILKPKAPSLVAETYEKETPPFSGRMTGVPGTPVSGGPGSGETPSPNSGAPPINIAPPRSEVNTNTVYGKPVNVAVPGEETTYPARYGIRELSDVQPSHNGIGFEANPKYEYQNDRDYKNNPEISSLVADRSGPKFDPNYVASESPTAEHGGPVIDPRGNVLGGNSRSMTLARVYQSNPEGAEAYKAALRDRAASYGLKPEDVDRFKQPVMVRELSQQPNEAGAQRAITDFNKKGAASLAPAERAVADGRLMSQKTVSLISAKLENVGEDSTLAQAVQGDNGAQIVDSLIKDGVVSQQERGALVDDRDLLTGEAKDRIAKMLVGRMFESPAQFQATPPELRNKLERVAPQVLRLEGRHGWNITPAVQEGLGLLADVRSHGGKSLNDFLDQPDLQGEKREYSPEAIGLARTLSQGPLKAASAFRQFANDEALSREGATATFFEPPTREQAFDAAFSGKPFIAAARVPRLSSGPSTAYVAAAPNSVHARLMAFEEYPLDPGDAKHAVAYVTNPSGIEYVHRMTGAPHDSGGPYIGGLHLTPENAIRVGGRARHMTMYGPTSIYGDRPEAPAGAVRLAEIARQAGEAGKSLILLSDHSGITDEQKLIGAREELDHVLQSLLTGSPRTHLGEGAELLAKHNELGQRAVRALSEIGYQFRSFGEAAMEIGVRLMAPNRHEEIGLSRAEARTLGAQYVRSLRKEHGSVKPREIAKRVFNALRRTDSRGGRQSDAGSRGLRPERGSGPAAGNGPDTSAYRPRANSDQGRGIRSSVPSGGEAGDSQADLFGSEANDQSKVDAQRGEDKLLGDRLTAQMRSGLAARPSNLKPAKNRGLFDEQEPETGGLFDSYRPPKEEKEDDVYFGSGLGALEPFFRNTKKEGDRLRQERSAALAAVTKARETPAEQHAGEKFRAWYNAELDLWSTRVNQAIDILNRTVAKQINEREAVAIMREFRHDPQGLQQFVDGTHPLSADIDGGPAQMVKNLKVLQPRMQEALAMLARPLTKSENAADRLYTNIADKTLKEGMRVGNLPASRWQPDVYVPHIFHKLGDGEVAKPPSHKGRIMGGQIGKFFGFAERREDMFPTIVHAVAAGIVPKTLDPSVAFIIHGQNFARSRATHLAQKALVDWNLGHWGQKGAPEGWVPMADHADEFRRLIPFIREGPAQGSDSAAQDVAARKIAAMQGGQSYREASQNEMEVAGPVADVAEQRLYVAPFIDSAMSAITDPDFNPKYRVKFPGGYSVGFSEVRTAQRELKRAILGFSAYHLLTENYMAAADIGPAGMWRAFTTPRESPDFLNGEREFIGFGGTTSIEGQTMEAYKSLLPGTIPTRAEVVRAYIPLSNQALAVADAVTRFTFENVQRRFKVTSFMLWRDAWMKANREASEDQMHDAMKGIASYVNGVYGGLHWSNMGINRAMVEVGRLLFLAPDWTGSNIALAKYAMDAPISAHEIPLRKNMTGAYSKESTQARLSRAFWTKQLIGGISATIAMSLMFSGPDSWKKWRPFQVYLGKDKEGKDIYQNVFFRGSAGDAVSLSTKIEKHSAEGYEKQGVPGALVGVLVGTGVFVGSKEAPFAKAAQHAVTGRDDLGRPETPGGLAADVLPVPIFARTVYNDFVDNPNDIEWSERMLSLFGPPAQHVTPAGHHATHRKPAHKKPPNTGWKKLLLGK